MNGSAEQLVSIVLPVFNDGETLQECIESLESQDYRTTELVVIDDGSTDRTPDVLSELSKRCPMKIVRTHHLGRSHAKNLGISESQGDLVAFAEADGKYAKEWISATMEYFRLGAAGVVGPRYSSQINSAILRVIDFKLRIRYHDPGFNPVTGWIFTKKSLVEVDGFDPNLDVAEDRDIGFRIRKAGYRIAFASDSILFHSEPRTMRQFVGKEVARAIDHVDLFRKYPRDYPLRKVALFWLSMCVVSYGMLVSRPITGPVLVGLVTLLLLAQALRLRTKARKANVVYSSGLLLSASVLDLLRNLSMLLGTTIAGLRILLG